LKGKREERLMVAKMFGGRVTIEVPDGTDVSDDGSVFGPDGLELAVYVEDAHAPKDLAARKEIIEGRCGVEAFSSLEARPDGWEILFETDDPALGFERGRLVGGMRLVFWGDRLPDEAARKLALAVCASAVA